LPFRNAERFLRQTGDIATRPVFYTRVENHESDILMDCEIFRLGGLWESAVRAYGRDLVCR